MKTDLFDVAGVLVPGEKWHWNLRGRHLDRVVSGWPEAKVKTIVVHYFDGTVAASEAEAIAHFTANHGPSDAHNQWRITRGDRYTKHVKPRRARD